MIRTNCLGGTDSPFLSWSTMSTRSIVVSSWIISSTLLGNNVIFSKIKYLAPFVKSKMIRSEMRVTYVIKETEDREDQLTEYDNYVQVQVD